MFLFKEPPTLTPHACDELHRQFSDEWTAETSLLHDGGTLPAKTPFNPEASQAGIKGET